jgi:inorganic pyrophosphatase
MPRYPGRRFAAVQPRMNPPASASLTVFVEIPAGTRNKYEYDEQLGGLVLDRRLFTSMSYPADYGFVEGTLAEDGDPLDALVLTAEPTFPGCRIRARTIGIFHMEDENGSDDKLVCVPLADTVYGGLADAEEIPSSLREEIEHFFQAYKTLEGKPTRTFGFGSRERGETILAEARRRVEEASREGLG